MSDALKGPAGQYLGFKMEDEVFAVDISRVREVLEYTTVTRIPQMPLYMRGAINLRGGVVPVVDLRVKFGMGETEKTINTCVIIAEVSLDDGKMVLGAMADSVQEVFDLRHDDIEPAPKIGDHLHADFLTGMGKRDNGFILILDMDRVFSAKEKEDVRGTAQRADREGVVEVGTYD